MKAKLYGGPYDGKVEEGDAFGHRHVQVDVSTDLAHTYVRDRDRYERDANGEITVIAFKFEKTEIAGITARWVKS